MNAGSLLLAVGCGCAIAGSPALAQVHDIVFSPDNDDTHGARNVDCGVAVSADVFVVSSNMTLGLYERDGTLIEQFDADDSMNFPFVQVDSFSYVFDPRAEYDVVNDRLWIMYSEETTTGAAMARPIHVAVSKTADPESLDSSAWWFYTGVGMSAGNGGEAIQAGPSGAIDIDHCFMSIDHQACYIVGQTHDGFGIPGVYPRSRRHHSPGAW
ncbi:MAG: hypothetical protein ACF8R7_11615 [Phycisphaerales bacterium JB039]